MSSRKPAKTTRRLLKIASLGLAGLVAGLLTGCSTTAVFARASSDNPEQTLTATRRLENLDYRRTPEIRRAPTLHHNQPAPPQRTSATAYAYLGEIDSIGHHYTTRYPVQ
jgi:hypothetical protein